MNVLLDVFICPFRKKSAPHLPEGIVKCSYLAPYKIHRARQEEEKNGAIAKVRVLLEQVILQDI